MPVRIEPGLATRGKHFPSLANVRPCPFCGCELVRHVWYATEGFADYACGTRWAGMNRGYIQGDKCELHTVKKGD